MSLTLSACILAHQSEKWLPNAVTSVFDHVDRVYVAVDDRTTDGTVDYLIQAHAATIAYLIRKPGAPLTNFSWGYYHFDDVTGFSGAYNRAKDHVDCDWTFFLDADEVVDPWHAANLRMLCEQGDRDGIDCYGLPRNNWWDLERKNRREEWFPDYQWRLMARHVSCKWRVHSALSGAVHTEPVAPELCTLQHFNLAYRTQQDWEAVNVVYDRLLALDKAEGRIL